jgi:hypothetical protein
MAQSESLVTCLERELTLMLFPRVKGVSRTPTRRHPQLGKKFNDHGSNWARSDEQWPYLSLYRPQTRVTLWESWHVKYFVQFFLVVVEYTNLWTLQDSMRGVIFVTVTETHIC